MQIPLLKRLWDCIVGRHRSVTLPDYVDGATNLPVTPAPYDVKDSVICTFVFDVDRHQQQSLCDTFLNDPMGPARPYEYKAFLPWTIMTLTELDGVYRDKQGQVGGLVKETEVAFWTPAIALKDGILPTHIALFQPYLFVDSTFALLTGREVFGLRKFGAEITVPATRIGDNSAPPNPEFSLSSLALASFTPQTVGEVQPLMQLSRATELHDHPSHIPETWKIAGEAAKWAIHLLSGNEAGEITHDEGKTAHRILDLLPRPEVIMVCLKQFRDASETRKAAFQSVIEIKSRIDGFDGGGLYPHKYVLTIEDLESVPVASELGLKTIDGKIRSRHGFWSKMAFDLGTSETIWKA